MSDRPLPTVIGPAENALRALLTQTLSVTGIRSYQEWVLLNMTAGRSPSPAIAAALRLPDSDLAEVEDSLIQRGILSDRATLSSEGRSQLTHGRELAAGMTALLTAEIEPEHLQICARVLDVVRTRAEEQLSGVPLRLPG